MQPSAQSTAASLTKPATPKLLFSLTTLIVALFVVVAVFASLFIFGHNAVDFCYADESVAAVSAASEVIADEENPLGAFQHDALCNIHVLIYLCTIMTVVYGATVVYRRLNDVKAFKEMDEAISGKRASAAAADFMEDMGHVGA